MKFKKGDVIKNVSDWDDSIEKGYETTVINCDETSVYFVTEKDGLRFRPVECYELLDLDLDESIERTKKQLEEIEKLILEKQTTTDTLKERLKELEQERKKQTPKVGDKYRVKKAYVSTFDDALLMITKNHIEGKDYYTLTILECNNPKYNGTYWEPPTTNLEDILNNSGDRLTKIN